MQDISYIGGYKEGIGNYMKKSMMPKKISVSVEFTDGYQQRFTTAILKIYEKRTKQGKQFSESKNNKSA